MNLETKISIPKPVYCAQIELVFCFQLQLVMRFSLLLFLVVSLDTFCLKSFINLKTVTKRPVPMHSGKLIFQYTSLIVNIRQFNFANGFNS